ncbi:MAG: DUF1214 domain-containing protein [Desulfobacterales bacterium]|nr:DUF1214 domain-containing protein [Desulfobacterales bacterium]
MWKKVMNRTVMLYLLAVVVGLAGSRFTLLPLVDYLGVSSGEGEIRNGPWVTGLKKGAKDQNFIQKAIISKIGIGNLTKEESLVWNAFNDSEGQRLHSGRDYEVHFPGPMPVENTGFWSLTLYNKDYFLAENPIGRYALGSKDPLKTGPDGSFTVLVSSRKPTDTTNWLPAPTNDFFTLNVRCYIPKPAMLDDPTGVSMPVIRRILG